jgi:hypothetical protein
MAARRDDEEGGEDSGPKKSASRFQLWFEEAWEGWLKSVGVIVLCAIGYLVYKFDLISEGRAGLIAVVGVVGGGILMATGLAWPRAKEKSPGFRAGFLFMCVLWAAGAGYPSLRAAMPPAPYAEATLTPQALSAKMKTPSNGPYELLVSGQLKPGGGEVEVGYSIKAEGGGGSDEVSGDITRKTVSVRVGRRGGTQQSIKEVNEQAHRLSNVKGNEVTVTADSVDDQQLQGGLIVELRAAGLEPIIFWVLGGIAFLMALFFDAKLTDPKQKEKTFLAVAIAITMVFAVRFPMVTTPHSLVRPAVDALILGALAGGVGGWILTLIARAMWAPKLPKKAKR